MKDYMKKIREFLISYLYSLHHLGYIYVNVFSQWIKSELDDEAYDGEAYNG